MKDLHIEYRPPLTIQEILRETTVRIAADHRCLRGRLASSYFILLEEVNQLAALFRVSSAARNDYIALFPYSWVLYCLSIARCALLAAERWAHRKAVWTYTRCSAAQTSGARNLKEIEARPE